MARTTRRQSLAAGTASAPTLTAPGAIRLALIADKMEELKESMDVLPDTAWNDMDDGDGTKLNMAWQDLYAEASRLPIETSADLVALARISQNIRASIGDDTNEEIERIRSNIDAALLGGVLPAVPVPRADAEIFAACKAAQRLKVERDSCSSDHVGGDDAFDRLVDRFDDELLALVKMPARTVDGWRAQAVLVLSEMQKGVEPIAQAFLRQFIGEASARKYSNPDAAYIALCEEILAAWVEYDRLIATDAEEKVTTAAYRKASEGFDRLMAMPLPVTAAGRQAAARVALIETSSAASHEPVDIDVNHVGERLAWMLVGQMAGREEAVALGLARSDQP